MNKNKYFLRKTKRNSLLMFRWKNRVWKFPS